MAELSRPWSGTVTGDAGPYSDDQWTDVWNTLLGPTIASEGVFNGQLNELDLSNVVSPVSINTGRALVDGIWYESDSAVSVTIPTPAANPRVDRIVLRKDWVLQTVRITRIAGAEAASPVAPAITQVDGTTWDLPLWQVHITTGAVVTHYRDERAFLGQYEPAGYSTPAEWYVEDEFDWTTLTVVDGDNIKQWGITIDAGAGNLIALLNESGSNAGAIRFSHGAGTGLLVGIGSGLFRPDQSNTRALFRIKEPNSDAELDRVIGFVDGRNSLIPTEGVFFRSNGTANWFAVTRSGGVETATDTAQALTNVYKDFEIQWRSNASVTFLIDGVVVANHITNIPSDQDEFAVVDIFDSGVAAVSQAYMDIDLFRARGTR